MMSSQHGSLDSISGRFRLKLAPFNLLPLEIDILGVVLQHGLSDSKGILSELPPEMRKGPRIYQALKKLVQKGWLKKFEGKPAKYALGSKNEIQKIIDTAIAQTQAIFQAMTANQYELLDIISSSETKTLGNVIEKSMKIHPKMPASVSKWIQELLNKEGWTLLATEGSRKIALSKEGINFNLSSAEFEVSFKNRSEYGGLFIIDFDGEEVSQENIDRIHQYNVDALNFAYKMEKKGYSETKKRELASYTVSAPEKDLKIKGLSSAIEIKAGNFNSAGKVGTILLDASKKNIITVWGESQTIFDALKADLKTLKLE
jgi:hypothetical protein